MYFRPRYLIYRPARKSLIESSAALEPVDLEVMKAHSVVTDSDRDGLIAGYIATARELVEEMTGRALITQTRVYNIDRFPPSPYQVLDLPGGTLLAVTSIEYVDTDGASQTWAAENYTVDKDHAPGRIGLAWSKSWPAIRRAWPPVTISYSVGYGPAPADVPEKLRTAIALIAAELFERREENVVGTTISKVSLDAKRLVRGERIRPNF